MKLESVVAAKRKVRTEQTAISIRELLEANVGARVRIQQAGGEDSYAATVIAIPNRKDDETPTTTANNQNAAAAGQVAILKTAEGYHTVPISSIQEVTFLDEPKMKTDVEMQDDLLALQLARPDDKPIGSAKVGMIYLQKGLRWIPNYRVELDGKGTAHVRLQATLINELADLENSCDLH